MDTNAPERIRAASPDDAERISDLALRSKGHWGYDRDFLEACRQELTLTPAFIATHVVFVADRKGEPVGFYALEGEPPEGELRDLFVDPRFIGSGLGRRLWEHMVETVRARGFESLLIDADPNAVPFYESRGAVCIGESPSGSIPGRMLPQMRVSIKPSVA